MGIFNLVAMAQSPRGIGVAAVLLVFATVAAFSGDVQSLDDITVGHELGSSASNSTNVTAVQEMKEPEEKKPSTAEEAELESYKQKVRGSSNRGVLTQLTAK